MKYENELKEKWSEVTRITRIRKEKEEVRKKDNYIRKEFNYQSFSRTFTLPETANEDKIEANYKDGILHVVIGKKESAKKRTLKNLPIK